MKVAVVGCGNISRNHFSALSKITGIEIVAAVDIKEDRANKKANEYGCKAFTDFDKMLSEVKPDCVHICTPHYLHTEMAVKTMKIGANVLTEKPCSVTMEEVDLLRKVQRETGKQLGVCFQNRYNESAIRIKRIIDSGEMGKVTGIRAFVTWHRDMNYYSDDWHGTLEKECGGVLINQAIHTIDLIQLFAGGIENVTAHIFNDCLKEIEVEDTATIYATGKDDLRCIVYATTSYSENSNVMVEISFEQGKLRLEAENLYKLDNNYFEKLVGTSDDDYIGQSYWGHGHASLIEDYYDCLKTGRKFSIDAFEGGKAAKIVAACYKSAAENKTIKPEN